MVDVDNMVKWIPLTFLIFAVFTVISALYIGGLTDITGDIDEYDRGKFRIGVVVENTVTVSGNPGKTMVDYNYRRGVIPKKFFDRQISGTETKKIGFAVNNGKCFIPRVTGLDGENFGFYLSTDPSTSLDASTKCDKKRDNPHASTPITVVSKDTKFHNKKERVILSVYEIE